MGILDLFKKKEQKIAANGALALDELPPIPPSSIDSSNDDSSQAPSHESTDALTQDLPPQPTDDELNQPVNSDQPAAQAFSDASEDNNAVDHGLEVPTPINNDLFEKLNANLEEENKNKGVAGYADTESVLPDEKQDRIPSQQEVEETLSSDTAAYGDEQELSESQEKDLPDFEEDATDMPGEQLSVSSGSVDIRTENLLLKSIFVERDHYANILYSLKRVKDDLQKSGPQQRKLSNIDMKLGKEYNKLSTLYENFNENIMVIEHIISNEKF